MMRDLVFWLVHTGNDLIDPYWVIKNHYIYFTIQKNEASYYEA